MGDRVRVRAQKGNRSLDKLVRVIKIIFRRKDPKDNLQVDVEVIPGIGGTPGEDPEETGVIPEADVTAPSITIFTPEDGVTVDDTPVAIGANATDAVGVVGVRFYLDGVILVGEDSTEPYSISWDPSAVADGAHLLTAVAFDAAGNSTTSDTVTVNVSHAVALPPPPPAPTGVLRVLDGVIVNEDDQPVERMLGGNSHCLPDYVPSEAYLDQFKERGGKFIRVICIPNRHNPSAGVWDTASRNNLDLFIARMEAREIHHELELHLNTGSIPSWWTNGVGETEKYVNHGQFITQAMAARYGDPASPQYSPYTMGFGLNEIPLDNATTRNGYNAIPFLESVQRTMISWFRASAPNWIGFVNLGYACQTPYPDAPRTQAAVTAYDSVGGNVIMDVHDYGMGCTTSDPNDDGRQANGNIQPTYQGGTLIWQISGQPASYSSNATKRSQMAKFWDDYETYCAAAGMALMCGEVNWMRQNPSGKAAWWADKRQALSDAGIQIGAVWELSPASNDWASNYGGVWDPEIEVFLGGNW